MEDGTPRREIGRPRRQATRTRTRTRTRTGSQSGLEAKVEVGSRLRPGQEPSRGQHHSHGHQQPPSIITIVPGIVIPSCIQTRAQAGAVRILPVSSSLYLQTAIKSHITSKRQRLKQRHTTEGTRHHDARQTGRHAHTHTHTHRSSSSISAGAARKVLATLLYSVVYSSHPHILTQHTTRQHRHTY